MTPFVYTAPAARVVFGSGTRTALADEIRTLSCARALILSTPPQRNEAAQLAGDIGELAAGIFSEATMHTPVDVT
jgi:maleylacetate reductase